MKLIHYLGALSLLLMIGLGVARAENPWEVIPDVPELPAADASGTAATANGEHVYYEIHGTSGPWIIFLHGGTGSALSWGNQVPEFSTHNRVLLIESRGHGRSTWNGTPLHYDEMADDVVKVMDALGIPKARIVGWSDGGDIAMIMAIRYPGRVEKFLTAGSNADTDAYDADNLANPPYTVPNDRSENAYKRLSPTPERWTEFRDAVYEMWSREPHILDQLKDIEAPALIVVGQYDAISVEHARLIADSIPGAEAVVMPDTSHYLPLQVPDEFNALVKEFLDVQ